MYYTVIGTTTPTTHQPPAATTSLSLKLLAMSKRTSIELNNSQVTNSGSVGDNDYDYNDLLREEEDTGEEGNINIPRPAKKSGAETQKMSDDELFLYFQELLEAQAMVSCRNVNCSNNGVHAVVAKYLTGFERKKIHSQDSIILDWYRFAEAMRIGRRQIWYCLLYDRTWCTDMGGVLNAAQTNKLCTKGLSSVLNIGHKRFQSIQNASMNGVIPPHKAVGEKKQPCNQ